jgi:hypothetical protein
LTDVAIIGCKTCLGGPRFPKYREVRGEAIVGFKDLKEELVDVMVRVDETKGNYLSGDVHGFGVWRNRHDAE